MARIKLITLEQFMEMQANEDDFVLVDTLPSDAFNEGHLPGAKNTPSDEIAEAAKDAFDDDTCIVTYCAGYTCEASTVATKKLLDLGYANVMDFKGGKEAWTNAGFELES